MTNEDELQRKNKREKVYISGQITGLEKTAYMALFGKVEKILEEEDSFFKTNADILENIEKKKDSFDLELEEFSNGKLPDSHIFNLGKPGEILQNCGFPSEHRIELAASRLRMKANQGNHPFEILNIQGLAGALQKPVAVFEYGDKNKSQNVIVNIEKDGKNFLVGVFFNQKQRGYEVSDIRGLFNRDNMDWMHWIQQGKMIYGNKEKIQVLSEQQRTNLAEVHSKEVRTSSDSYYLDSVDNILQSFGDVKDIYTKDFPKYAEQKERFEIFKKFRSAYQNVETVNMLDVVQKADEFYDALKSNNKAVIARYTDTIEYTELADAVETISTVHSVTNTNGRGQPDPRFSSDNILTKTELVNKTTSTLVIDSNQSARIKAAREIKENMPSLSEKERAAAIAILEAGAKSQGIEFSEYVEKTFPDGIFGDIKNAENAAKQQGIKINGAVSVNGFGENVKAVIYAGKTADFSTWCHELSHIWQAQLTGELKQNAEEAFQVKNSDWQNSIYTFQDGHTDTSAEAFAYGFEDFLKNKAGEMAAEDKKKIFEKFVDYMSRTYNGVKQHIEINEKIASVYQKFVELDDNILAQAEKAVQMEIKTAPLLYHGSKDAHAITSAVHDFTISQLTNGVKPSFSKMIDENGEPLVAYHGSPNKGFDVFDKTNSVFFELDSGDTTDVSDSILEGKPIKEISTKEFNYDGSNLKDFALNYIKNNPVENAKTKIGNIEISETGLRHSLSHTIYKNKLYAIPAIKDTLEKGTYLGVIKDFEGKRQNNYYFAAPITIDNDKNILFIRVKHVAGRDKTLYIHDIFTLDEIKKVTPYSGEPNATRRSLRGATLAKSIIQDYEKNNIIQNNPILFQTAYHGSGANFDKFNTSEYGLTGEGSMAFGYGVYVSNSESIAKSYAGRQGERYLYTVEIPDGNYINWNKPVSKTQKESVKNELYKKLIEEDYKGAEKEIFTELNTAFGAELDGRYLYGTVSSYIGSDKETSKFFKDIGFSGIQYPAGTVFGDGQNAVNYVIFNDEDIKIKEHFQFQKQEEDIIMKNTENLESQEYWKNQFQQDNAETFKAIDDYLDKGIRPKNDEFIFEKIPKILKAANVSENEIVIKTSIINKAKNEHSLSDEEIKDSIKNIASPVLVFDSDKTTTENKKESFLCLTDTFAANGKPIAFSMNIDSDYKKNRSILTVNQITSIHDRTLIAKNGTDLIQKWTENGLCRYVDDKKISEWQLAAGVQFPLAVLHSDENNIALTSEIVNGTDYKKIQTFSEFAEQQKNMEKGYQEEKKDLNVATYKFQSGETLEELLKSDNHFPSENALLDNLMDGDIRAVYRYATEEEENVLRQFAAFKNDYDTDMKNLAVQTDCISRWIAAEHWNPEKQEFQKEYVNQSAIKDFPYKLPWEMKEIEDKALQGRKDYILELKIHSELKAEKIKNLEIITQEEFDRIVDALYQEGKPDYKNIPEIIRLPKLNDELAAKLNIDNKNFFLKTNIAHSRPQRKGGYAQSLRKEEMKGMLDFISSCQNAYIDTDERHQNFFLAGLDEKDNTKANKIVFNKDELGNYIVTIGKVETSDFYSKNYTKVAVGVEPTIWRAQKEHPIATMLRSSTTLATEETISQVAEKSINEERTKLQILEQEDKEQLAAIVMTARESIKDALEKNAEPLVEIDFSKANYDKLFPRAIVQTPIETVKLGENQFEKLDSKDRKRFLLATFQTLATPDIVIDEEREGSHSHNYIKSFVFDEKTKTVQDVVVNINGENVSITAHPRDINNIVNKIKMPDQLVYAAAKVGQVIEQRVQHELGIVNPTRADRLSTISVPLNKEYSIENALSIISEFQTFSEFAEQQKNMEKGYQEEKEELNVSTYKFQSGETLEELLKSDNHFPSENALLDNLIDGDIRAVYRYATEEEQKVLRQFEAFRNDYDIDIKNLAVQTDCISRWIAAEHWNPEKQEFQKEYVNQSAIKDFPYKLPWEMKEIEAQVLKTKNEIFDNGIESIQVNGGMSEAAMEAEIRSQEKEHHEVEEYNDGQLPLQVVAHTDFNYFNSDKISFREYIVRTDASVVQDLIEKNADSFNETNTKLEENAIPCIIVRKSVNPEIPDQFLLSKYENNNLNKDEIAKQAGKFASKEIKIENTELITQIKNVIDWNDKQNKTQTDIPELKIYHTLKEDDVKNLEVISDQEFSDIVDSIILNDYKNIPNAIRLPNLNDQLSEKLGLEKDSAFILKKNATHIRPDRKGSYGQAFDAEEYRRIPEILRNADFAVVDTVFQNFQIVFDDKNDGTKINKLVFNKDELGNYLVTLGKVDRESAFSEERNPIVAVGVAPTIQTLRTSASSTALRASTTMGNDSIPQVTEKSINAERTKLQILEQEDKEQLAAIVMTARENIKDALEKNAEPLVEIDFSKANYDKLFPFGIVQTPLEKVKLGENQFEKLDSKDRKRFLLATFQTLATPDIVIDEEREGSHSHNYIKSFVFDEKTKTVQDVVVNINGENVSITAHPRDINNIVNKIKMPDQLVYAAARVGQVIEQRTQEAQSIVNPTRADRLSTISVPLNKEYSIENALSIISEFQTFKGQRTESALMKKFEKLKNLSKEREESEKNSIPEKDNPENKKHTPQTRKSKSDIIRQAGKDFLESIKNGIAPFFNAEDDFQRIIMHPQAIINSSNGLPFSGESQLLAQIYHKQHEMEGEIVTSMAGAKAAGTIVINSKESKSLEKNFALTDTSQLAEKKSVVRTRYFMPESCKEPDRIYAHTLQQQRPDKIRGYRDLIRHFENIPNGQKEIADLRIRISHEHLKEIQSRFATKEERILSVDEIEERKNFLRNYFERLPSDYRSTERSAFEDTFGIQLNPEKTLEINLERKFKDIDFEELKKNTKKSIELENRKLSTFIEKNTMENKKLASLFSSEYKTLAKEEKLTAKNLKIEALGIKEPETFLGKYLAACNTNAEFITDPETVKEVKKNLVKKLEENFKIEKYDILKEIGQQAQSISNETTKQISFEKAHSNKKNLGKMLSPDNEISLIGMGK